MSPNALLLKISPQAVLAGWSENPCERVGKLPRDDLRKREKARGLWAFKGRSDARSVDKLVNALNDSSRLVRCTTSNLLVMIYRRKFMGIGSDGYASKGLRHIWRSRVVPALVGELTSTRKKRTMRLYAATALGLMGDARALPILSDSLKWFRSEAIRQSVGFGLAAIPDLRAASALMDVSMRDPNICVRQAAWSSFLTNVINIGARVLFRSLPSLAAFFGISDAPFAIPKPCYSKECVEIPNCRGLMICLKKDGDDDDEDDECGPGYRKRGNSCEIIKCGPGSVPYRQCPPRCHPWDIECMRRLQVQMPKRR